MPNTRENLIELLKETSIKAGSYGQQADYLIASGVTLATDNNVGHKWIPVTERLPKEDEDVIAFCYWHESWQAQVCHLSFNYEGQWYTSVAGQWVHVTHWMPLPEPPTEETP